MEYFTVDIEGLLDQKVWPMQLSLFPIGRMHTSRSVERALFVTGVLAFSRRVGCVKVAVCGR
jgi:hypothetical protein